MPQPPIDITVSVFQIYGFLAQAGGFIYHNWWLAIVGLILVAGFWMLPAPIKGALIIAAVAVAAYLGFIPKPPKQ